jgi:predicted ATPase
MYLRTLGGLWLEGSEFRRPKPLLLLAYLALEGAKPRRYLAELFFMDASDQMNSLSRALSYLRQEVPGVIEADNKKVWATVSCDSAELLSLTDTKKFEKCLELYQGAFAADYELELSEELEEWLYGTREILAAKARNAFLSLGESEAAKSKFAQAALLAEKAYKLREAVELEPDDFGRLYNLLYAGNSPLAAEVRKEAEGFEIPLQISREEAKAQLSEAIETASEIPNNLPPPKTSFIGRDQELIEIAQQLFKKDCRLLTLHGMGGIGKSRLAIQAAYDQLQVTNPSFKDGVHFVTLDALTSAELIPSSIAEALSLELQGQEDTLSQVKRFIGKKHQLLLLDNYEHLMAGAMLTSKLLEACPNLKLLVTSRERLNVEEEWVLTLDGLAVPTSTELSEAERFDALNLFVQRSKRAMLEFSLTQETLPHALKICQLVEGSPLGIELAAVWVKTLPVSDIAKEIESNLNILEAPTKNIAERHQNIRAVFEHSWKLLTEKEQEVLRKLSVFIGGFRREAASEVAGATLPTLASLVDKSLLRVFEGGKYKKHPLIYHYSWEKLANMFLEREEVYRKHCDYYLNYVQAQNYNLNTVTELIVWKKFDEEIENIRQAWSHETRQKNLIIFTHSLQRYQERRGLWHEALSWLEKSLESARREKDMTNIASCLRGLGFFNRRLRNYELSAHYHLESLAFFKNAEDCLNIIESHIELGWSYYFLNDFDNAEKNFIIAEALGSEIGDETTLVSTNHGLGLIDAHRGSLMQAQQRLMDSMEKAQHLNIDSVIQVRLLGDLADIYGLMKDYQKKLSIQREMLLTIEKLQDTDLLLTIHSEIGETYRFFGRYELAQYHFERLRNLAQASNHNRMLSNAYAGLAEILLDQNRINDALQNAHEAELLVSELGGGIELGRSKRILGEIFQVLGQHGKSKEYIEKAVLLLEKTGSVQELAKAKTVLKSTQSFSEVSI